MLHGAWSLNASTRVSQRGLNFRPAPAWKMNTAVKCIMNNQTYDTQETLWQAPRNRFKKALIVSRPLSSNINQLWRVSIQLISVFRWHCPVDMMRSISWEYLRSMCKIDPSRNCTPKNRRSNWKCTGEYGRFPFLPNSVGHRRTCISRTANS